MPSGFRLSIGLPASFTGVAIAILFALFEVQEWKMPTPIAISFIAILSVMIVVALGMVVYEVVTQALRYLEHRATTASWVSSEEPGLLDYEADGLRAIERLTREMAGLAKDTQKLGRNLQKHTQRLKNPNLARKPRLKQKRANQAAKSIDRSAVYIEKRAALMKALVKDVSRNYAGLIATVGIETEEDRAACEALMGTLATNSEAASTTSEQTAGYRDSVRSVEDQNLSRTVRIASKRLADALDETVKILRASKGKTRQLHEQLARRASGR